MTNAEPAPDASSAAAPSPERLVDALRALLPAQFDLVLLKLRVPVADLSAASAPQTTRSIEVFRWAEGAGRLAELAHTLAEVGGGGRAR